MVAPTVGYELADYRGNVVADAELAWPEQLIVVLREDQTDMQGVWTDAGWRVLLLDDAGQSVGDGTDWVIAVGEMTKKMENEGLSQ